MCTCKSGGHLSFDLLGFACRFQSLVLEELVNFGQANKLYELTGGTTYQAPFPKKYNFCTR
jgi:hypothetical protein